MSSKQKIHYDERDGISIHQTLDCLRNRLFKAQIKENVKAPRHWLLWWEFTGDRWIPRKGPVTRKMFQFFYDVIVNWHGTSYTYHCICPILCWTHFPLHSEVRQFTHTVCTRCVQSYWSGAEIYWIPASESLWIARGWIRRTALIARRKSSFFQA